MSNIRHILSKIVIPITILIIGIIVIAIGIKTKQNYLFIIGGAGLVVVGLITSIFMLNYEKIPRRVFTVLLILFIPFVALFIYMDYSSISDPIKFEKEYQSRADVVKKRLLAIADAEVAYRTVYGKYTGSFDSLINFIKNENLVLIKKINNTPHELADKYTEEKLLQMGYIKIDTIYKSVIDSIFKDYKDFNPDNIRYIPFSNPKEYIELKSGTITRSKVKVPVFVAIAAKENFLQGLDEEYIADDKIKNLQVGSMSEPIRDGNWE